MLARVALVGTLLALAAAGCGTPIVGEACSGSPQLGGCADGALCLLDDDSPVRGAEDDVTWDTYTCRAACTSHADCGAGFSCEIVPTTPSLSACQPRTSP